MYTFVAALTLVPASISSHVKNLNDCSSMPFIHTTARDESKVACPYFTYVCVPYLLREKSKRN